MKRCGMLVMVWLLALSLGKSIIGYSNIDTIHVEDFCMEQGGVADLIIFSYDRPLQLRALLDSLDAYMTGLGEIYLVYRTSSIEYERAYQHCFDLFKHRNLHIKKQGANPGADFKPLTLEALRSSPHDYVLFAVDDILVKDYVNLSECVYYLKKTDAYGFYLRLGEHITESYSAHCPSPMAPHAIVDGNVMSWRFADAPHSLEWHYPNTVDMTVYKKSSILGLIELLSFSSPNTFEGFWAAHAGVHRDYEKVGLFYRESKIVNIPFNLVQEHWHNAYNMGHSKEEFLRLFNEGYKIDISRYFKLSGKAPHVEAPLYVIKDECESK